MFQLNCQNENKLAARKLKSTHWNNNAATDDEWKLEIDTSYYTK